MIWLFYLVNDKLFGFFSYRLYFPTERSVIYSEKGLPLKEVEGFFFSFFYMHEIFNEETFALKTIENIPVLQN